MMSGELWGAIFFSEKLRRFETGHPYDPIIRILRSDVGQFISAFQATPERFSATVQVKKLTDDPRADQRRVDDELYAAWFGVPVDQLSAAKKAHYEKQRAWRE